jgi:hypothetical protein
MRRYLLAAAAFGLTGLGLFAPALANASLRRRADGYFSVKHPRIWQGVSPYLRVRGKPRQFAYVKFTRLPDRTSSAVLQVYVLRGRALRIDVHLAAANWSDRGRHKKAPRYSKAIVASSNADHPQRLGHAQPNNPGQREEDFLGGRWNPSHRPRPA